MTPLRSRRGSRPLLDRINARRPLRVQWDRNPDGSSFGELLLGLGVLLVWFVILFLVLPLVVR